VAERDNQQPVALGSAVSGNPSPAIAEGDPAHPTRLEIRRSPNVAQAVLLGSTAAQLLLALLVTIYLARVLSPAAFGFFSLIGTVFILARKFLDLGMGSVAARDIARDARRERPILEGMMAYRRAGGIALALGMLIFAFRQTGAERAVLLAVSAVLLFTEPAALDPVFQVRQAQEGPALLNLFGGLLVLGGSVLFKRVGLAGAVFGWLLVLREALILLFTKILAERLLGYPPKPGFRGRALRAFVGPAVVFGLASLVYTVYFHCDVLFVFAMRGTDELGAYAAAFRPVNPLLLLPWVMMLPLIPVLSAIAAKDMQMFVRQVRGACALGLGLGACGLVAGTLLAPELVQLLYRGQYLHGALSCVNAFRWLTLAMGEVCVTTVLAASLLAAGKEKLLLAIGTAALVVNAAMNLLLLRYYNFTAAGFATAATELLYLISALVAFSVVTRQSALIWSSLLNLLPAIVMAFLLRVIPGGPMLRVACGVVLGAIAVAVILLSPVARRFRKEMAACSAGAREEEVATLMIDA
jgi:O-antigen/teichoic acid export membrane protein